MSLLGAGALDLGSFHTHMPRCGVAWSCGGPSVAVGYFVDYTYLYLLCGTTCQSHTSSHFVSSKWYRRLNKMEQRRKIRYSI
jgi:hypothetical protein